MRSILFLLLVSYGQLFSQIKADTLRLYFNINESDSPTNNLRLDSLINKISKKNLDVGIYGYADYLSDKEYNNYLSRQRAEKVKDYLSARIDPSYINFYVVDGLGELYSKEGVSPLGDPKYRRVDLYLEPIVTLTVRDDKLETPKTAEVKKASKETAKIESLNAGEKLTLEGLTFEPGRHFILPQSTIALQKLLESLNESASLKIEIQGHVCCTQNGMDGMDLDTKQMKLSENRAKAIYDYLISKGIDKKRLKYKGFARSMPKFILENTPEEEQANRRVEILVLEK